MRRWRWFSTKVPTEKELEPTVVEEKWIFSPPLLLSFKVSHNLYLLYISHSSNPHHTSYKFVKQKFLLHSTWPCWHIKKLIPLLVLRSQLCFPVVFPTQVLWVERVVRTWHVEMQVNLCVLSLLEEVAVALETSVCGKSSAFCGQMIEQSGMLCVNTVHLCEEAMAKFIGSRTRIWFWYKSHVH